MQLCATFNEFVKKCINLFYFPILFKVRDCILFYFTTEYENLLNIFVFYHSVSGSLLNSHHCSVPWHCITKGRILDRAFWRRLSSCKKNRLRWKVFLLKIVNVFEGIIFYSVIMTVTRWLAKTRLKYKFKQFIN